MGDKPEGILLLLCQCMKILLTRQEKTEVFSRTAFKALWNRQPLEQDDARKLRTLQEGLDDAQALADLQELHRKLDAVIPALKDL